MPRTSATSIYNGWQKRNPGPSDNDDLDITELFTQAEDEDKGEDEEPHGIEIIDDEVSLLNSSHHKGVVIDILWTSDFCTGKSLVFFYLNVLEGYV